MPLLNLSKNLIFDRLTEVKGVAKTSKPSSSAYGGTVELGLRSKSKCLAEQAFAVFLCRAGIILRSNGSAHKAFADNICILTVGGYFDTLRRGICPSCLF